MILITGKRSGRCPGNVLVLLLKFTVKAVFMKRHLLACLMFFPVFAHAQNATFTFNSTGTAPQIDSALEHTGQIWGAYLNSDIPIKVRIYYVNLADPSNLAITIPNGRRDFPSAALDSVWYPTSLANSMEGSELNPGEADMDIYVNSIVNWYFATDGNPGGGQHDFVTVMLHEIGHGLGFLALVKEDGALGSFGTLTAADLAPLTTSFPFPDLQKKHSIFSTFMENGMGQALDDTLLFPNPSAELLDEFTGNSVYFNGPLAMAKNGGNAVRLYAPATFAFGSSLQHVNENSFPASNPNALMTPFVGAGEVHHTPGPLTIAMLEDIGWNVNHDVGLENTFAAHGFEIFPNPANSVCYLRAKDNVAGEVAEISDLLGRTVSRQVIATGPGGLYPLEVERLPPAVYFVRIKGKTLRMVKQ